jgi:ABC-2 type transport system ATP-binding protein
MRSLAAEGRTVFVSSHLMSEMEHTADHLVVIGKGRLIADLPAKELIAQASGGHLVVRTTDPARLIGLLARAHGQVTPLADGGLRVTGLSTDQVGRIAFEGGVPLLEMTPHQSSLEEAYMELSESAVEYRGAGR